mmetsp:Transcript_17315/g.35683  ORF Transcript_17315/g.35683 Transcript_17315/m.35683 type:complete len:534 (+) Transcript_17315:29-1630(+)
MSFDELPNGGALSSLLSGSPGKTHALVMFTATWCGPCKAIKPVLQQKIASEWGAAYPNVAFCYIYESSPDFDTQEYQISAFPTFKLFALPKSELGSVRGGNMQGLEQLLMQAKSTAFEGTGNTMGGGVAEDPREARLRRLAGGAGGGAAPMQVEKPDDSGLMATLMGEMGFEEEMARKGLDNGGGTLEGAIDWIMLHQDDDKNTAMDIEPSGALIMEDGKMKSDGESCTPVTEGGAKVMSYKCNECGKILSNMANLELHANKSGHSDFSESTEEVKPLTAEEKAAKVKEIKALLKAKRAEREEAEKVDHVQREKQRREMGKQMGKTREEMEKQERKKVIWAKKKEKEDAKKERERIRAELAKDKLERQSNGGKLKSQLGADGYNPSAIKYDEGKDEGEVEKISAIPKRQKSVDTRSKETIIAESIAKLGQYRAGGDGGNALKLLGLFVGNVVDKPTEDKYRGINTEGKAYKTKIKGLIGGKKILEACGWKKDTANPDRLVLGGGEDEADIDWAFLKSVKEQLAKALVEYNNDF